jgi:predicted acyltransferase
MAHRAPVPTERPGRLLALDAFRGAVMLTLVSGGLGLAAFGADPAALAWCDGTVCAGPWRRFLAGLVHHFSHVPWTGCGFWDLVQPAFMFMVGVAAALSLDRRRADGEPPLRTARHVLARAAALVALGVFVDSAGHDRTAFVFTNVLAQIGLGYPLVCLLAGRGPRVQLATALAIAVVTHAAFLLFPLPPPDLDPAAVGRSPDWRPLTGLAAHFDKGTNVFHWFDARWLGVGFLNLFPRAEPYRFTPGGYQTLNFVPATITMILGLVTGELLLRRRDGAAANRWLFRAGAVCLACGLALDGHLWPGCGFTWSLAPAVKRIWTPSWAVYSAGWSLCMLAAFHWLVEVRGLRGWTWPLVTVGMNSLAAYLLAMLLQPWIVRTLRAHLGADIFAGRIGPLTYPPECGPVVQAVAVTLVVWLVLRWMERRRLFLRL